MHNFYTGLHSQTPNALVLCVQISLKAAVLLLDSQKGLCPSVVLYTNSALS